MVDSDHSALPCHRDNPFTQTGTAVIKLLDVYDPYIAVVTVVNSKQKLLQISPKIQ